MHKFKQAFSKLNIKVFKAQSGARLDRFLVGQLNRNWNDVQKFIRNGEIQINSQKVKIHDVVLKEGDEVSFWEKLKKENDLENESRPIPSVSAYEELKKMILYENNQIIILNKKHGYASQGGANPNNNIPEILNLYFKNFYIIHRLDQLTAGLLIIAKNKEIAVEISRMIQEKTFIQKKYVGVVQGKVKNSKGLIDCPLQFNTNNQKQECYQEGEEGKFLKARTHYEVIDEYQYHDEIFTLLDLQIFEGRKHQIRAHLSQYLNTPILFDQKYGFQFTKENRILQNKLFADNQGILLQAKKMQLQASPIFMNEKFYKNENGTLLEKNGKLDIEVSYSKEFQAFLDIFKK